MVIFAVQNGGWCAAANTLARYRTYGKAGNCKNGKGGAWANNVYRIKKTGKYSEVNTCLVKSIGLSYLIFRRLIYNFLTVKLLLLLQNLPISDVGRTLVTVQFHNLMDRIEELLEITKLEKTPYINASRLPERKEW